MNSFRFQTFILLSTSPALRATACLFYHVSSSLSSKQTVKHSPPRRKLPLPFFPQVLPSLACSLNLFALSCDSFIIISPLPLFVKYEFVKVSFNFSCNLYSCKSSFTDFAKKLHQRLLVRFSEIFILYKY